MIAMVITATLSIGLFLFMFWLTAIVSTAKSAIATSLGAIEAMRDPELGELARERTVRKAAIRLVVLSISLILCSLLALVAAFVPIVAADWAGVVSQAEVLDFMGRWDVILIATGVIILGYVLAVRLWSR